jgi:hypothetical protein
LFVAAARIKPSSNSRTASSRIVSQFSLSLVSSGKRSTSITGWFGIAEPAYISTL